MIAGLATQANNGYGGVEGVLNAAQVFRIKPDPLADFTTVDQYLGIWETKSLQGVIAVRARCSQVGHGVIRNGEQWDVGSAEQPREGAHLSPEPIALLAAQRPASWRGW